MVSSATGGDEKNRRGGVGSWVAVLLDPELLTRSRGIAVALLVGVVVFLRVAAVAVAVARHLPTSPRPVASPSPRPSGQRHGSQETKKADVVAVIAVVTVEVVLAIDVVLAVAAVVFAAVAALSVVLAVAIVVPSTLPAAVAVVAPVSDDFQFRGRAGAETAGATAAGTMATATLSPFISRLFAGFIGLLLICFVVLVVGWRASKFSVFTQALEMMLKGIGHLLLDFLKEISGSRFFLVVHRRKQ